MWDKPAAAQFQQITEQRMPLRMAGFDDLAPIKLRRRESLFRSRVRDAGLGLRRAEAFESRKLFSPALHDLWCQLRAEVAEKQKWRGGREFLPHEQQWNRRRKQKADCFQALHRGRHQGAETFTQRTIADLVMVLDEIDKGAWRQAGRNFSARAAAAVF